MKFRSFDLDNQVMYHSHLAESNGEDQIDWRIDQSGIYFEEVQIIDTCPGGLYHKQSREWRKPNQSVMEFTGFTTSYKEDVWEGDYISNNFGTTKQVVREVIKKNGCWMANVVDGKTRMDKEMLLGDLVKLNFKVVGNVHTVAVF